MTPFPYAEAKRMFLLGRKTNLWLHASRGRDGKRKHWEKFHRGGVTPKLFTLSSEQKKESVLGSVNNRMCRGREGSVLHIWETAVSSFGTL